MRFDQSHTGSRRCRSELRYDQTAGLRDERQKGKHSPSPPPQCVLRVFDVACVVASVMLDVMVLHVFTLCPSMHSSPQCSPLPQACVPQSARQFPTHLSSSAAPSARRASTPCGRSTSSTGRLRGPRVPGGPASPTTQTLTPAQRCSSRSIGPLFLIPSPLFPLFSSFHCSPACFIFLPASVSSMCGEFVHAKYHTA